MLKNKIYKTFSTISILFTLALGLTGNIDIGNAAEPIQPPFEDSLKERYAIIIAEPTAGNDSGGSFKIKKSLWDPRNQVNNSDDVTISNFSHLMRDINGGNKDQAACYILVVSQFRKHPLFRDEIISNPEGMAVQTLPAVGPGAFHCSPQITRIYTSAINKQQVIATEALHDLMILVESADRQSHRIAAFELAMRADLMQQASQQNVTHLRRLLNRESLSAEANEMLIQAAKALPESLYQDWFREYLLNVLNTHQPANYELAGFTPLLVRNSILTLLNLSLLQATDWSTLSPFIYSNAPGVAKAAIRAQQALSATRFQQDVATLLADNNQAARLHSETKRVLEAYLQSTEIKSQ